jgi:hypothetical protein
MSKERILTSHFAVGFVLFGAVFVALGAAINYWWLPPLRVSVDLPSLASTFAFLGMCAAAVERAVELLMTLEANVTDVERRKRHAAALALVLSAVLSIAGVRLLGACVEVTHGELAGLLFGGVDVLLTSCLIAAGSDVVHQYVEAVLQFGKKLRQREPGEPPQG